MFKRQAFWGLSGTFKSIMGSWLSNRTRTLYKSGNSFLKPLNVQRNSLQTPRRTRVRWCIAYSRKKSSTTGDQATTIIYGKLVKILEQFLIKEMVFRVPDNVFKSQSVSHLMKSRISRII